MHSLAHLGAHCAPRHIADDSLSPLPPAYDLTHTRPLCSRNLYNPIQRGKSVPAWKGGIRSKSGRHLVYVSERNCHMQVAETRPGGRRVSAAFAEGVASPRASDIAENAGAIIAMRSKQ